MFLESRFLFSLLVLSKEDAYCLKKPALMFSSSSARGRCIIFKENRLLFFLFLSKEDT